MTLCSRFLALMLALPALTASAQHHYPVMHHTVHHNTTVVIPENFEREGIHYDLSVNGIRKYVRDLESSGDKDLAPYMASHLQELEARQDKARNVAIGLGVGAGAAAIYSLTYKSGKKGSDDPGSDNFMNDDETEIRIAATAVSILLGGAAIMSYNALAPNRRDFMETVNDHNRKAKETQKPLLNIKVGLEILDFESRGSALTLGTTF